MFCHQWTLTDPTGSKGGFECPQLQGIDCEVPAGTQPVAYSQEDWKQLRADLDNMMKTDIQEILRGYQMKMTGMLHAGS